MESDKIKVKRNLGFEFKLFLSMVFCFMFFTTVQAKLSVTNLLTENRVNPVGLDVVQPRFNWQLLSDKRNIMQKAYEIRVLVDNANGQKVWSTGKIDSDSSVHISYKGAPLQSGNKYFWQVKVWDNLGEVSSWSEPAYFQTALFTTEEWKAKWIQQNFDGNVGQRRNPYFRKTFFVGKKIKSAIAYITAHGLYEAYIDGQRVGDAYLTPGWTSYNKRLQYQTYDLTSYLQNGENAIGVILGNGWYRGYLTWDMKKDIYGKDHSLLFQLDITFTDGSKQRIVSDNTWKSSTGAIKNAELYDGDFIDLREEKLRWNTVGFNDDNWAGVQIVDSTKNNLIATYNEPIKKHETFHPIAIITTPKGEKVLDFGQNLVGWVKFAVSGHSGDSIRLQHFEVLDKEGNVYTKNLRSAKVTDIYILKGTENEILEPHFTFHGFRYVKIEGYPGTLNPDDFTAIALYSDMAPTGTFTSSDTLINKLQHNIQWGLKGNFLDVPTDCPQRDERLGWTGDAQVFSRTAAFNMNVNDFFAKWLKDVAADQMSNGSIPFVIPDVLDINSNGSTGWGETATVIPWDMYLVYGDKKILEQQYSSMKGWVEFMRTHAVNDLWQTGFHFGDWLFYRPFDDNDGRSAVTDKYLIAQCFYAYSTQLLINAACVLNNQEDINTYSSLLKRIKNAFLKEYVTPNGRLISSTQTAYVLALNFDMLPENLRQQAAGRLVQNVKDYNYHLTTGFLGTPYLCHVLSRFGYSDIAYKLLLQKTYPSWLYPVTMGATTIWERWDGQKPDGTFQTPGMNSFNHYSYGAIGDWMYRVAAGIDTYDDGVGYKHIKIKPHISDDLPFVSSTLKTYYGQIFVSWEKSGSELSMNTVIPANTKATIFVPAKDAESISENGKALTEDKNIKIEGQEDGYVILSVGSGNYQFVVK